MAITKPSNTFTRPFAESGSKNTIPANSLIGTTAGAASLADGFPPLTMTPLAAGGVPPSGKDMNGILNQISQHTAWGNAGGNYQFDSLIAAAGGYPVGATVYSNDWSASYRNVVAGNAVDFNAVPSSIGVSWLASPFIKQSGGNMSGVFRANAGTGLNAGIKGASDTDTGFEWLQDGVLQTVINGVVRQKSDGATTQIMSADKRFEYQANGNIVSYDPSNNALWNAFNTYQKSDYSGSVGAGWYRTPHPSIATGIIKQWGITTAMGQDSTLAVSFPIAFPNSCNFVVLTENGVMDGSGSGSMSVDLVTSSGFTIRKGTDVSHTVRWVAEGY